MEAENKSKALEKWIQVSRRMIDRALEGKRIISTNALDDFELRNIVEIRDELDNTTDEVEIQTLNALLTELKEKVKNHHEKIMLWQAERENQPCYDDILEDRKKWYSCGCGESKTDFLDYD